MNTVDFLEIYAEIARLYDFVNHLVTGGLDLVWRNQFLGVLSIPSSTIHVDIACGTGETLRSVGAHFSSVKSFGVDLSPEMLKLAQMKCSESDISFGQVSATHLPFLSDSIDLVTITFALRNLESAGVLEQTFSECIRILRPGGNLYTLETSQPQNAVLRKITHGYSRFMTKLLGKVLSRNSQAYEYLGTSVSDFLNWSSLSRVLTRIGFIVVECYPLFGGIAAIHRAQK